jgi:hypothetical protein
MGQQQGAAHLVQYLLLAVAGASAWEPLTLPNAKQRLLLLVGIEQSGSR